MVWRGVVYGTLFSLPIWLLLAIVLFWLVR